MLPTFLNQGQLFYPFSARAVLIGCRNMTGKASRVQKSFSISRKFFTDLRENNLQKRWTFKKTESWAAFENLFFLLQACRLHCMTESPFARFVLQMHLNSLLHTLWILLRGFLWQTGFPSVLGFNVLDFSGPEKSWNFVSGPLETCFFACVTVPNSVILDQTVWRSATNIWTVTSSLSRRIDWLPMTYTNLLQSPQNYCTRSILYSFVLFVSVDDQPKNLSSARNRRSTKAEQCIWRVSFKSREHKSRPMVVIVFQLKSVIHSNHGLISHCFQDKRRFPSRSASFSHPPCI